MLLLKNVIDWISKSASLHFKNYFHVGISSVNHHLLTIVNQTIVLKNLHYWNQHQYREHCDWSIELTTKKLHLNPCTYVILLHCSWLQTGGGYLCMSILSTLISTRQAGVPESRKRFKQWCFHSNSTNSHIELKAIISYIKGILQSVTGSQY